VVLVVGSCRARVHGEDEAADHRGDDRTGGAEVGPSGVGVDDHL
jgi:hypothetical protein